MKELVISSFDAVDSDPDRPEKLKSKSPSKNIDSKLDTSFSPVILRKTLVTSKTAGKCANNSTKIHDFELEDMIKDVEDDSYWFTNKQSDSEKSATLKLSPRSAFTNIDQIMDSNCGLKLSGKDGDSAVLSPSNSETGISDRSSLSSPLSPVSTDSCSSSSLSSHHFAVEYRSLV